MRPWARQQGRPPPESNGWSDRRPDCRATIPNFGSNGFPSAARLQPCFPIMEPATWIEPPISPASWLRSRASNLLQASSDRREIPWNRLLGYEWLRDERGETQLPLLCTR